MFSKQLINQFQNIKTPFYFYDTGLLHKTLFAIKEAASPYNYHIHYALKANANSRILQIIKDHNIGADCVSANEIRLALKTGIMPEKIVFAGVGKTDDEIRFAIKNNIHSINCESIQELEVINQIAGELNKKPRVALRINPNIDAKTHQNITTGLSRNKFGISFNDLKYIVNHLSEYKNLFMDGIHFHVGSQITQLKVFQELCHTVNDYLDYLSQKNIKINHINLGGGLGIDYQNPEFQIPDFQEYFKIFNRFLKTSSDQTIHFEPGRSIVGQCGFLISRVLYVKETGPIKTIILDSGMTEFLRPALYQAKHKIINITARTQTEEEYDVAGPICESTDYFGKSVILSETSRGNLLAILSTGAYGESMASQYNLRSPAQKYFSEDFEHLEKMASSDQLLCQNHY